MKRLLTFLCLALCALAVVVLSVGCGAVAPPTPTPTPSPTPQPLDLALLHTNDVIGYTEPCGWTPPKGGLARRASLIKATRGEFQNVLLLDAGDALWSTQDLAIETQGKVMIDAMNLLSYDAMALGDQDLELGVDVLRQRIAESKFPILSANVTLTKTKELLAKPYVLKQVGGHGVAIIGVTGNLRQEVATDIRDAYVVLKADDVLAKYVAEVQSKADVIIVLSTLGYDEDMRLSSAVPGIDVILGGVSRMPMQDGWRNEKTGTLIYQAGSQGEWIGRRVLHFDSAGVVTNNKDELILLTEDYADDPEMRGFLNSYTQK